ncbi:hypothetical protein TU62_16190 [Bacillus cereus]|nr:hypothetical protein TU62_16190 [Bacillus cereus]
MDETYIKVKGEWRYLYRAIDKEGYTLDIQLRKKRDHQAAYAFMKRLVKTFGEPTVLTTDKAPALLRALKKLYFKKTLVHINYIRVGKYLRIKLFISPSKVIFYRNILTFFEVRWFIMQIRCCSYLDIYKERWRLYKCLLKVN